MTDTQTHRSSGWRNNETLLKLVMWVFYTVAAVLLFAIMLRASAGESAIFFMAVREPISKMFLALPVFVAFALTLSGPSSLVADDSLDALLFSVLIDFKDFNLMLLTACFYLLALGIYKYLSLNNLRDFN